MTTYKYSTDTTDVSTVLIYENLIEVKCQTFNIHVGRLLGALCTTIVGKF